ncbi:DUF397 domain-containing protein [Streptomyces sindenensis]|uniref:DUF397 domain-containing protein n=1 Tax=Streptomyces sindenensis TaxID=67363 RepID=UPI001672D75B|nr:DUF397 domain-containing protein [Streptomyces sindenensis]GGP34771.1 hypothetical protein GCM10010231_01860 [Streptomyces sindenensis]
MTTEVTTQLWVKSSYSNSGTCVEWAPRTASATGTVPVRDSKNPGGPALAVAADAFSSFVAGVKAGGFGTTA